MNDLKKYWKEGISSVIITLIANSIFLAYKEQIIENRDFFLYIVSLIVLFISQLLMALFWRKFLPPKITRKIQKEIAENAIKEYCITVESLGKENTSKYIPKP